MQHDLYPFNALSIILIGQTDSVLVHTFLGVNALPFKSDTRLIEVCHLILLSSVCLNTPIMSPRTTNERSFLYPTVSFSFLPLFAWLNDSLSLSDSSSS